MQTTHDHFLSAMSSDDNIGQQKSASMLYKSQILSAVKNYFQKYMSKNMLTKSTMFECSTLCDWSKVLLTNNAKSNQLA